jgi:hypothetical protein
VLVMWARQTTSQPFDCAKAYSAAASISTQAAPSSCCDAAMVSGRRVVHDR